MRRYLGMACLAAACVIAPVGAKEEAAPSGALEDLITMRVDGELVVGTDGKVASYVVKTKVDDKLKTLIDQNVAQWRFETVSKDGQATRARSDMRITLVAKQAANGYDVHIDNVVFMPPGLDAADAAAAAQGTTRTTIEITKQRPMPQYPHYSVNGLVTLMVHVAPDGTVADIDATQCSLYFAGGSEVNKKRACKAMEDNALRAIRQWHFKLSDKPGAETVGVMPVQYRMPGARAEQILATSKPGKWRLESRGPYRKPAWARDANGQRVGTADAVGDELLPSNSILKFRSGGPEGA
ncbi:energy transducer TonB [Lysobacter sp. KIS68-7]|uniref:energy transducer TonB n=1 Tax=Lysobacter sp. KIS68-7 TaxID=2904252 RepID=UPI001E3EB41E|nr:energy transducer TonB [Lysobacter sp. KIS68-7]UHQ20513.1 energy transducer TonB [Lysobacter sp. KIS68-7]